jgi:hypothetical protein
MKHQLVTGLTIAFTGWTLAILWMLFGWTWLGWLAAGLATGGGLLLLLLPFRSAADADDWEPNASDFDDDEDDGKPLRVYVEVEIEAEYTIR